eukprot:5061457-Prymnesium_polylepis.1
MQGAQDFTPCHSVQPGGQAWSCKLTRRRCVRSADYGRCHASSEAGKPAVLPGVQVHGDASRR